MNDDLLAYKYSYLNLKDFKYPISKQIENIKCYYTDQDTTIKINKEISEKSKRKKERKYKFLKEEIMRTIFENKIYNNSYYSLVTAEMVNANPEFRKYTIQVITEVLTELVNSFRIDRIRDKGKYYYSLPSYKSDYYHFKEFMNKDYFKY